ncbi:transporter substrate-binding domain-containing protein [Azospirillum brasilense]|uniref:transporter substrate-binding domain-containing protein n=1 Tax=Azospirillum brasilense TaxID=192 RepID=UPI001EDC5B13|nr:amino acid ABC transporter substrate-binding protein [Azospirillum brasilense]UKJ72097.1 amino acid ABC transporter substrate-binding protein [Azospirillum brasilense]
MLLLLAAIGPVRAAPLDSALDLVTGNDFAPFTGEDLPEGGLLTDIVRRAFDEVGLRYGVRFMPWRRGYDGVLAGKFLGTFPYVRTPDREMEMLFSDPLLEVQQLVYLSAPAAWSSGRRRISGDGRSALRSAMPCRRNWRSWPRRARSRGRARRICRPACGWSPRAGWTPSSSTSSQGRSAVAKAMAGDEIRVAPLPYARAGQHLFLSRSLPEAAAILAAFNAGLKKLKDGGAFEEMLRRHLSAAP